MKSSELLFHKVVVVICVFSFVPQYKLDGNIISARWGDQNSYASSRRSETQVCAVSMEFDACIIYVLYVLGRV